MKLYSLFFAYLLSYSLSGAGENNISSANEKLFFHTPAKDWKTEALHLGNGYFGVSFYGDPEVEKFSVAEKTCWTGGPGENPDYCYGIRPGGKEHLSRLRQLILDGQIHQADSLAASIFTGDYQNFGAFSRIGELLLDFNLPVGETENYIRTLDLAHALGQVSFERNHIRYEREYFCSYPDRTMAIRLNTSSKGALNFTLEQKCTHPVYSLQYRQGEIIIQGNIKGNNRTYCIRIRIRQEGGQQTWNGKYLRVQNASKATIFYTVATDYAPLPPLYQGENPSVLTRNLLEKAFQDGYETGKKRHISDYQNLYQRVCLTLAGDSLAEQLSTPERLALLREGYKDDSGFKTLLFNFGRYLLISASRPGTLPSNLQGTWNFAEAAPWGGNYQSNINLQLMYSGCGPLNLSECQEPYIEWIKNLVIPGREVARAYYGTEGWVSHATGNIWGYAAPGNEILWGLYPCGAAWHCRHLWQQYEFTQDKHYLTHTAYPILKEAALFWIRNLISFQGYYISAPTVSAEHGIELHNGQPVPYSTVNGENGENKIYCVPGIYQDIEMIGDLFNNVLKAAAISGDPDTTFLQEVQEKKNKLLPLKIGQYGQLQEFYADVDNPRDHHRHIAHLYALYPGEDISPFLTPELAQAAGKSLQMRGDGQHGQKWPHSGGNWSAAWRIWCWARLLKGEEAIRIFNNLICQTGFDNLMTSQSGNAQVDASMSAPGFIAEMLLQSQQNEIHLLPALPAEWPEGKVQGLIARGNIRTDLHWKHGKLVQATFYLKTGNLLPPVRIQGKYTEIGKDPRIVIIYL